MPWWWLLSHDIQRCGSDMRRLENGGSMQSPGASQMFFRGPPQKFAWMATMTEHRCLAVLGIWQKCRRLDPGCVELTGRCEKPREVFLVRDDISETRIQHFHYS